MINAEYEKFNLWIYNNFLKDHHCAHIASLFVDIMEIENNEFFKRSCDFLRDNDWKKLCFEKENIPSYLGLIAIQILAASSRQDDNICSSKAYNPRLMKYLSMDNSNSLQKKYLSSQESIYKHFKQWCENNSFGIYLSESSKHLRFVQYPLSLALLHKKDIESLGEFFDKIGLASHESVDYEKFKEDIKSNVFYFPSNISKKWKSLIGEEEIKEAIIKQMYSAYLYWDGGEYRNEKRLNKPNKRKYEENKDSMFWERSKEDAPEFYRNEDLCSFISEVFWKCDGSNKNDWYKLKGQVILLKDIDYAFTYIKETDFSLALCREVNPLIYDYSGKKLLHFTQQQMEEVLRLFPDRFKGNSLYLEGGVRLSYNEWMEGAGPRISINFNCPIARLHCYNMREERDIKVEDQPLIHLKAGKYFLQYHPETDPIDFSISSPRPQIERNIKSGWLLSELGWHITGENSHIHGLDFSQIPSDLLKNSSSRIENVNRIWMDLATKKVTKSYDNENIIHKVLRRNNDGIRNR